MTAAVVQPDTRRPAQFRPARFSDAARFEWTKFRSVRSTYWTLLVAVVLGIGLSALFSALASNHYSNLSATNKAQWDPTSTSTSGLALAVLAIGVLGVMTISTEYSTGMITTSMAAVPRRYRFLGAKALVYTVVALVVGEIMAFVSFFIGQTIIQGSAPYVNLGDHDVLRAVIGAGLDIALTGLLALAIAAIVRSTAAGIAILVAVIYVLPGLAAALPDSIEHTVEKFWPTQAGGQITSVYRSSHTLSPWLGFGWMALITAAILAVAFVLLQRRDV
jgi:hypothetical protein